MARIKFTAGATETKTLLTKNNEGGGIKSILVSNVHSSNTCTFELFTDTGIAGNSTDYHYLLKVKIPPLVSLLVDSTVLGFNSKAYSLKAKATNGEINLVLK